MPYQTLPPPQPVAGVQPGAGFYVQPPTAADLEKLKTAATLERDRRKEAATAQHTAQAAGIQAQRDMRLAKIDAAHTGYQANIQAERDARQAGYADLAEQNAAGRKAALAQQANEFATEHAKLADQFEQGHQYRAAGYQAERDYNQAGYESGRQERAAELQSARDMQLHGQQQQLSEQQHAQSLEHLDVQGQQQAVLQMGHAQLQDWLQRRGLSNDENARLARIKNQIGSLDSMDNLSDQEKANARTQLQTGLDPLHQRALAQQLVTQRLQQAGLEQQNQMEAAHLRATQDLMAPGNYNPATGTTLLPNGTELYHNGKSWAPVDPHVDDRAQRSQDLQETRAARLEQQHTDREAHYDTRHGAVSSQALHDINAQLSHEADQMNWTRRRDPTQPGGPDNPLVAPAWSSTPALMAAERDRRLGEHMQSWRSQNPRPARPLAPGEVRVPPDAPVQDGEPPRPVAQNVAEEIRNIVGGTPGQGNANPPPTVTLRPSSITPERVAQLRPIAAGEFNRGQAFAAPPGMSSTFSNLAHRAITYGTLGQMADILVRAHDQGRGLTIAERAWYESHHRQLEQSHPEIARRLRLIAE